jgi:ABC-type antimicrobial peptide transport system permease subunit
MKYTIFYLKYALNQVLNGGQRVFIAILAVAFGVMSLIAMVSVSQAINSKVNIDPRVAMGGDMHVLLSDGKLDQTALDMLDSLQSDGLITAYSPVSEMYTLLMRTATSGKALFINSAFGVNPDVYPLVGEMVIGSPQGKSFAELLSETGAVLITHDLATQHDLAIGDALRLATFDGTPLGREVVVSGIIQDTPQHRGQRLYYNLATAQALRGEGAVYDYAVVVADDVRVAQDYFLAQGFYVSSYADVPVAPDNFFTIMLRGSGVLGLIVGGIGIANTMQVLLAQRRQEIGILKTLGTQQQDLILIFVMEAALLGVFGSIPGAIIATWVGQAVTNILAVSNTLLITWSFDPLLTIGGVLIGIFTTVLFALHAIMRASKIRPSVIFRHDVFTEKPRQRWLNYLLFYAVLAVPFAGVTTIVMESVVYGIGILIFALAGLIGFSIVLMIISWVLLRIVPVFRSNLIRMARNNIRKRIASVLFAMIALFIGIFTMGFAMTIIQSGFDQFYLRLDVGDTANVMIYADATSADSITDFVIAQGGQIISDQFAFGGMMASGQVTISAVVDIAQEQAMAQAIGEQFPYSMTLTQTDVMTELNRLFMNLLWFALAMAGLALLAGVLLMANVVSLALVERRYEIGVMKAVGYTQRHILMVIGAEYGLIGLVASLTGVIAVQAMIILLTMLYESAEGVLVMNPLTAVLIVVLGIAITCITALMAAWKPTQVQPVAILNDKAA